MGIVYLLDTSDRYVSQAGFSTTREAGYHAHGNRGLVLLKASFVALVIALAAAAIVAAFWNFRGDPIGGLSFSEAQVVGGPAEPNPIAFKPRQHPYFGPEGWNNVGGGSGNAGVQMAPGPLGRNPTIHSRHGSNAPGGECATAVVTREDRLIVSCGSLGGFELNLLAPRTLELLAVYEIPQRPSTFAAMVALDPDLAFSDTTGGAYFYLDNEERVVFADPQQSIWRIGHRETNTGDWEFYVDSQFDLSDQVPHDCLALDNWFPDGECDPITAVAPDYDGKIWWVTRHGRIGTVDPETGSTAAIKLDGEGIQNSVAVGPEAIYVVSDRRLYAMTASEDGTPEIAWQEEYERSDKRKYGQFDTGSGTTPTLLGDEYVIIGDNAPTQSRLLVFRRGTDVGGERLICAIPLFEPGASAVEISVTAFDRSVIVKNEYGYTNVFNRGWEKDFPGGIQRINIRPDESGCDIAWTSTERTPSITPRLSSENGLLYTYSYEIDETGEILWNVTAIRADSGETAFKIPTGEGEQFDASWAPITLGSDGTLYVGTTVGLLAIWDTEG